MFLVELRQKKALNHLKIFKDLSKWVSLLRVKLMQCLIAIFSDVPMLIPLTHMSVIENPVESDSLFVSGGFSIGSNEFSKQILKVTCTVEKCTWTKLKQELKVGRHSHVSFMIKEDFNCTYIPKS